MSIVSIDGITVGYDDEGSGEPLVLVHGHPFDRSMWRPQVERFSRAGWRVVAPDLRGYGESTVVPGKTPLATFAHDLAGLLDHLDVDRVVLGGVSMGGQIALEFHRLFPHRVRALVLADTSPQSETEEGKKLRNDTADRLLGEGMGPFADEVLPKMIAPYNLEALPAVAEHVLGMMRRSSPEGAAAALRGRAERPDYVEMLRRIAVPTLVVVGRDDEFTPVSDARLMHERIPDATLVVVDGAGHLPNLERPAEFNGALGRFLTSVAAVPAAQPVDVRAKKKGAWMPTRNLDIPGLAEEFTAAHPDLDASQQRLVLAVTRLLGEGEPVTPRALAGRTGFPLGEIAAYLEEAPTLQRDRQGRVVAFFGLTLEPTSHALVVDGRTLYAWCALDTLFLPARLGWSARIRSTCPQTGETISLTVDAEDVREVAPQGAVMSLHGVGGLDLGDAVGTFCCFVHFFASEEAARAWTERKEGTYVVSIAEGFEYGRLFNHGWLGGALEEGGA